MKIIKAQPKHKEFLYTNWKKFFAMDDFGSIDFYFRSLYDPNNCYVLIENGEPISSLMVHPHQMVLHEKIIDCSLIVGLFTIEPKQGQGYMKYLLNRVLMEREKLELITLMQSDDESLTRAFGFEPVYYENVYTITRSMVPPMDSGGVRLSVHNKDLLELYRYYTTYFNGYFLRDEHYFDLMKESLASEDGRYVGVYDSDSDLRASLRMVTRGKVAVIEELLYKDTLSIVKLLAFVLSQYPQVEVHTTTVENLNKIVSEALVEKRVCTYVRLNSSSLFERLYNVKVKSAESAMNAFGRALVNHEYY